MRIQAIEDRRSIRKFKADEIPKDTLRQILEAARLAPSAKNDQPWKFLVLGEKSRETALSAMDAGIRRRMELEDQSRRGLASAAHTLRVMRSAPAIVLIVRPEGNHLRAEISGTDRVLELMDAVSVGAAVENMLLEAQALGLGTLWIGNTIFAYEEIVEAMQIDGQLLGAVAIGVPDESPEPRPRKALEEIAEFLP